MLVQSMKHYTKENFKETLRNPFSKLLEIYLHRCCIFRFHKQIHENNRFCRIDQKGKSVNDSKTCFDLEIIYAIQKRDKIYSKYKNLDLETDKVKFKTSKIYFQKMIHGKIGS